ncbi:hypothetical protein, partial [Nocardia brasiliensis]|uniref:hypothetical protein n=1 Tax=Nocardia brasiliensis TaxID=37326 RepID=UPI00245694C9
MTSSSEGDTAMALPMRAATSSDCSAIAWGELVRRPLRMVRPAAIAAPSAVVTRGSPVAVFRSDMILAHSRFAGQLNVSDMFTRLVLSVLATGVA